MKWSSGNFSLKKIIEKIKTNEQKTLEKENALNIILSIVYEKIKSQLTLQWLHNIIPVELGYLPACL